MESENFSKLQWSSSGLLGLLRSTLQSVDEAAAKREVSAPPERLSSAQLSEVANEWRHRASDGDQGAESVAQALELVASHRSQEKQKRIHAMGRRLSEFMGLN
ncbi:hypothetical protein QTI24_23690 [Variovorax sp. J22P240]|uniref:hypothetical protein n=1 Tax=Variovorax sp. J22P240 TaxID=3053514 RepID=UPI0025751AB7|nr:hypothetical protein [Variovorax sp. J22P240]MDM0001629.1 hypothetical protein [Variovorax sp. J22P240]